MQFNRTKSAEIVPPPTPSILVEAAVAGVKPVSLSRQEARVSELRDRRSEISAELHKHLEAARLHDGGLPSAPTEAMTRAQTRLDACDADLRAARADMISARHEFAPLFDRAVDDFRRSAGNKLVQANALISEAQVLLAAVEYRAQASGIEAPMQSHALRHASTIIEPIARSYASAVTK